MLGSIYIAIKGFFRIVVKGSPRLLALNSLIWIMFGLICGAVELGHLGFLNIFTFILFGWAAVEIILVLIRWSVWRKAGLRQWLPDGTTFLRIDHVVDVRQRSNILLNTRTTTTTFYRQVVPLIPPATGTQNVAVRCATCQQELAFKVASLEERRKKRLRAAIIATLCLLLGLGLAIVSSDAFQTEPLPDWVSWARPIALILLVCGIFAIVFILNYVGAVFLWNKSARGHRVRQPEKADFVQFRQMVDSAASGSGGPMIANMFK